MNNYSNLDLQKLRLYNNGLIDKFESADMCVESLIGIQCQYQNYALISIYNRTNYKCNIFSNNNLIKSWGQRTTLHIYHKNDYNLISDLYRQSDNWVYKYAKHLKIDYSKYLNSITDFFYENNKKTIEKLDIQNIIPKYKSKDIMAWSGLLILATYHKVLYGILNEEDKKHEIRYDEITEKICTEMGTTACNQAKKDVEKMKENFNLTLDLAKVIGKSTIESLKEWYEIFKSTN